MTAEGMAAQAGGAATRRRSRSRLGRWLTDQPLGAVGLAGVVALACVALFGPYLTPYDPTAVDYSNFLSPPSSAHFFGTDVIGRDIAAQLIDGARVVSLVVFFSIGAALVVGTAIGIVAGYVGGWIDAIIMRVVDALLAFPVLILALVIIALLGPDVANTIAAIAVSQAPGFARLARGQVLIMRRADYVDAARSIGCSDARIILQHVLPNIVGPLLVYATLHAAQALIAESSLSFLGLGVQPPNTSWGLMIADSMSHLTAWWLAVFPGACIFLTILFLNLLGDALRDRLDVRGMSQTGP
jgi:peptide/nickel transport system permease protein